MYNFSFVYTNVINFLLNFLYLISYCKFEQNYTLWTLIKKSGGHLI